MDAAAKAAHQKNLDISRLYGNPASPDKSEFMHLTTGHALMCRDDLFYMHPLSERYIIGQATVPCPNLARSAVYRNTLDITPLGPCMHCDRECVAGRVPLPRAYDHRTRTYAVWGNFCSFPCVMRYQLEHGAGVYETNNVLMLIQKMASEVWKRKGLVRPAPPRIALRKFGGHVDPDDIEALSRRQQQSIVETPFISWAMFIDSKSVDTIDRVTKALVGCPTACRAPSSAPASQEAAPSEAPCRKPAAAALATAAMTLSSSSSLSSTATTTTTTTAATMTTGPLPATTDGRTGQEGHRPCGACEPLTPQTDMNRVANDLDTETKDEAHARIARMWNVCGIEAPDPNMDHPGALCREGGIIGIDASAGKRDAERRAEHGISLLGAGRTIPIGGTDNGSGCAAGDALGRLEIGGETPWQQFLREKALAVAATPSDSGGGGGGGPVDTARAPLAVDDSSDPL